MRVILLATLLIVALAGCGGDDSGNEDTGSSQSSQGFLNLSITDAPIDEVDSVIVQFTGVEIQPETGDRLEFEFEEPRQIDLLDLQSGVSDFLLAQKPLPAGRYSWIRLKVETGPGSLDSYVKLADDSIYPLVIPSGNQSGLKLNRGFIVPAGATASFTIDFDLRKSVHKPSPESSDEYRLRPTLRLVDNVEAGSIAGTVDPDLISHAEGSVCAVYLFEGRDAVPADININGSETGPLTTASIKLDPLSGEYTFRAAFLNAGDYTLAFTCQAGDDDPETDDHIIFGETANVAVLAGAETICDFLLP